jgi:hypothetical protein
LSIHTQLAGYAFGSRPRDAVSGRFIRGASGNPEGRRIDGKKLREKLAELRQTYSGELSPSIGRA